MFGSRWTKPGVTAQRETLSGVWVQTEETGCLGPDWKPGVGVRKGEIGCLGTDTGNQFIIWLERLVGYRVYTDY